MSERGIIAQEADQLCEYCGKMDECRPYGPNGEEVCFDCAMTKVGEETVQKQMMKHIFGEENGQ